MGSPEVAGWRPRELVAVTRSLRVGTIPCLSYRMKQPKVLFLAVIAFLPLLLISCVGASQPTGGWSGPTVHDDLIYVGSRDGRVVAINASTRQLKWQWPDSTGVRNVIYATPIVYGDLVYVATYGGQVCALTLDQGSERWVYPRTGSIGPIVGTPVVVNETIYVTSSDGNVYALNTTYGDLKWRCELGAGKLWTSPTVVGDTLYVSTLDGHIYSLSLNTGKLLAWSYEAESGFASSPVAYEGDIYAGSFDRYLYAIGIGSNVSVWKFPQDKPADNWFWASPLVNEGVVYAGCLDGRVYAIEAETGEELWEFDTGSPIVASPVLMDRSLIVANEAGDVYVFDVGAQVREQGVASDPIPIGAAIRSPFCAQQGLAYIAAADKDNHLFVVDINKRELSWNFTLAAQE
jgi:outer membrane protein assembly factor BamB